MARSVVVYPSLLAVRTRELAVSSKELEPGLVSLTMTDNEQAAYASELDLTTRELVVATYVFADAALVVDPRNDGASCVDLGRCRHL
jgi:hypothetical protein